jgi:hypothetical protein
MFYGYTHGIFYDHLAPFVFTWYIFSGSGIMPQEKSGNPGYLCVCFPHHPVSLLNFPSERKSKGTK